MPAVLAVGWAAFVVLSARRVAASAGLGVIDASNGDGRDVGRPSRVGAAAALALILIVVIAVVTSAPLALLVVGGMAVGRGWRLRQVRRRAEAAVIAELPEVVDLFLLAVTGGLTVPLAVGAVAKRAPPSLAPALATITRAVDEGARSADALEMLPRLVGHAAWPLVSTLTSAVRYGDPTGPALERLATEVRLERRRRAEEEARRLPVKLLFPLVLCTLPAFALLTVVPLLVGTLRTLRL